MVTFKSFWGAGGLHGGPPGARLLLQPQQAVGDALLVPWQTHPDFLDVAGNKGGRKEKKKNSGYWGGKSPKRVQGGAGVGGGDPLGMDPARSIPWGWIQPQFPRFWGARHCLPAPAGPFPGDGQTDTAHPDLSGRILARECLILSRPSGQQRQRHGSGFLSQHIPVPLGAGRGWLGRAGGHQEGTPEGRHGDSNQGDSMGIV